MVEPLTDVRLEEVKRRLRLIGSGYWLGMGREWMENTARDANDEILALEIGLGACVDKGTADMMMGALKDLEKYTTQLIDCGDCGNWDSGATAEVAKARAVIAKVEPFLSSSDAKQSGSNNNQGETQ